jgi:hypothetical protein
MAAAVKLRRVAFTAALIFGIGQGARHLASQTQSEGRPYELNAGDLQSVGLRLPSTMSKIGDLEDYQKGVTSRQEMLIDWDAHTGYDHPVYREQVAERLLKHEFTLVQRKRNVKGDAQIGTLMLLDSGLEVVAVTSAGEVRGLANGPSLVVRRESYPVPGLPLQEHHDYVQSKNAFWVGLPDDPKIEKLVLLLTHPNEKPRLEQVGTIDLTSKAPPK